MGMILRPGEHNTAQIAALTINEHPGTVFVHGCDVSEGEIRSS
jgi:hypothetical protein